MISWIKNHPAESTLAAISLGVVVSSAQLYQEHALYRAKLASTPRLEPVASVIPTQDLTRLNAALAETPIPWSARPGAKSPRLLASKAYVQIGGKLQRPEGGMFHPGIPNDWLLAHGLDPSDPQVLTSDPDRDGFSTRLEWNGSDARPHLTPNGEVARDSGGQPLTADSTNPNEASSHPPYHTRLVLQSVEQIPFRLRFQADDVSPKGDVIVQINATPGRSEFIEVGKAMKHSPFTVLSHTPRQVRRADGTMQEAPEITVRDHRTGQTITLPKGQVVDSPESYAILRYEWSATPGAAPRVFRCRLNEPFSLAPENTSYRLTAIRNDGAEIALPDGQRHVIQAVRR